MAVYNTQVTVSTTAQSIVSLQDVTQWITLHSKGSTYLGGSSAVSSTTGLHLENGDTLSLVLPQGCELWCVAASGTHALSVLTARVD